MPALNPNNLPVNFLPAYVPSRAEADRNAAMPGCSVNWYKAMVGDAVAHETGRRTRCPACGGVHLLVDYFEDAGQVAKALRDSQHNLPGFLRDDDGVIRYGLGNAEAGVTVKSVLGYDVDAVFGVPAYRPAGFVTKDIGNDDPRVVTKG